MNDLFELKTDTHPKKDRMGSSTLYSDSTVANGSTYYYAATAVDISGKESSKTAAVKAVIPWTLSLSKPKKRTAIPARVNLPRICGVSCKTARF